MQDLMAALSSPRRRSMLKLVWEEDRSAGEVAKAFDVSWPAISQNLRVLKDAGLVRERREGTRRFYRADRSRLGALEPLLIQMWSQDLDRLRELAESEAARRRGRS